MAAPSRQAEIEVALLTGGQDPPYAYGLATALSSVGVRLEIIGGDGVDFPEFHTSPNIRFLNLRGDQSFDAGLGKKIMRVLRYYTRLVRYAASARPKIFHILWNNKFELLDRTLMLLYYRFLGKRIVLTAHNVNIGRRDLRNTLLNRLGLHAQYRLADHIFLHTEKMKRELLDEFGPRERAVSVIPFGINNSLRVTGLTRSEARGKLGISCKQKVILFFGAIAPYKGLDLLVEVFLTSLQCWADARLIIAGTPKAGSLGYMEKIQERIRSDANSERVLQRIQYIPDDETEVYFKAADVAILPYREVYQSGVLFLAYSFGLPVIASDVGSLAEEILEGETGFLCKPGDPAALAEAITRYFQSSLYRELESRRQEIRNFANAQHSWNVVGERTRDVYLDLLRSRSAGSCEARSDVQ